MSIDGVRKRSKSEPKSEPGRGKFVPRRGRPSAAQVAAIDRVILATAQAKFFEEGYAAAAMEVIAATAGVAKGTLYARYPTKEDLFKAVIAARTEAWSQAAGVFDHLLDDKIAHRLDHHARIILASLADKEIWAFTRLITENAERFPEIARSWHDISAAYMLDLLSRDIAAAVNEDGIAVKDPEGVADRFISTLFGWYFRESLLRPITKEEREAFASRTVELFMAARSAW